VGLGGGLDWLSIAVGITALGAIVLAFWIAPEVSSTFDEPFGDYPHLPNEDGQ